MDRSSIQRAESFKTDDVQPMFYIGTNILAMYTT